MNDDNAARAAALIADAWRTDQHIDCLPDGCGPADTDEAYRIQSRVAALLDMPQVGWKIAATSRGGQQHVGVEHPLIGRLFADRVYPAPATLLLRHNHMQVAEAEFCFRFGRDLPLAATNLTRAEVMDHVDGLFPAIEVPDSRFSDYAGAGAANLVADNACAREFVLGDEVAGRWRDIALDRFPVNVLVNGEVAVEGIGADVLGDPRDALTWLVNQCGRLGFVLKRGQLVTTGVLGRPVAIAAGDHVVADFGVLGVVELTLGDMPREQERPESNTTHGGTTA
jgi:2-keto-4-pentenoate hydratase